MLPTVVIDCFPQSAQKYRDTHAIVAVDVIRATTTAVTAVSVGWRVFPTPSLEAAVPLAARLPHPVLVGELGGNMPYGFDMTNSPAEMALRTDVQRPMILLSTSGTLLLHESRKSEASYVACLRNFSATICYLTGRHQKIAILGAGGRGEFREEDQMCCSWIAEGLIKAGYQPASRQTQEYVERWRGARPDGFLMSKSVEYLRRSNQLDDLDFILNHIDDIPAVFVLKDNEIAMVPVLVPVLS
jgi:2-phosphosulfolactate phosphatase